MNVIYLESSKVAMASSLNKCISTSCTDFLVVSNQKVNLYNTEKIEILLKFLLDFFDDKSNKISKAHLKFYAKSWNSSCLKDKYKFILKINQEPFGNYCCRGLEKPKTKEFKKFDVKREELDSGCITVDVTDVLEFFIDGNLNNYGISIEVDESDTSIFIYSENSRYSPKLSIHYEKNTEKRCVCTSHGLEVQLTDKNSQIIKENDKVIFNCISTIVGNDINYNKESGEIIICSCGLYSINWWVSMNGSDEIQQVKFMLENEEGSLGTGASTDVYAYSQISGNSLVYVDRIPQKISLVNKSGGQIQYSSTTMQSNLTIFKV